MQVFENIIQGSDAWDSMRAGRATASEFKKIITATGKRSTARTSYIYQLVRESICKDPQEFEGNKYTDWGSMYETNARLEFERLTGLRVVEVGFCCRDDNFIGCSPDGLIQDERGAWYSGLEIKCPSVDKHVRFLMDQELPKDYKQQVHGSMAVTGFSHWWFLSYFPGLPAFLLKIDRDEYTGTLSSELDEFLVDYAKIRPSVIKMLLPGQESDNV